VYNEHTGPPQQTEALMNESAVNSMTGAPQTNEPKQPAARDLLKRLDRICGMALNRRRIPKPGGISQWIEQFITLKDKALPRR
jgi:hypothetical protein